MKTQYNKIYLKACLIGLLLMASANSFAAPVWTQWAPVHLILAHDNGNVYLQASPQSSHVNPHGCKSKWYYVIDKDAANKQDIYQMLLTAKAAGMRVSAYMTQCHGSYPKIQHLRMVK